MKVSGRKAILLGLSIAGLIWIAGTALSFREPAFPLGLWRNDPDMTSWLRLHQDGTYDGWMGHKRESGNWEAMDGWLPNLATSTVTSFYTDEDIQTFYALQRMRADGRLKQGRFLRLEPAGKLAAREFLVTPDQSLVELRRPFELWGRPKPWLVWAWERAGQWCRGELPPPSRFR